MRPVSSAFSFLPASLDARLALRALLPLLLLP
jgi:hypothetical protein